MCIRAVSTCSFVFDSVPDRYRKYKDKAVNDNPNALDFVSDQYKTQEMCDKAVDDYSIEL